MQVLVRWGIQHGTSVIPKASSEAHLRSNLDILNWEIPKDDFKALSSLKFQVNYLIRMCCANSAALNVCRMTQTVLACTAQCLCMF